MAEGIIVRRGGSGGGVALSVSAYSSADAMPATASDNDVAIISSIPVNNVTVSFEQPANAATGDVWLTIGEDGTSMTMGGNGVTLPIGVNNAMQYDGTAWQSVDAYIWQNGAWVSIESAKVYLIRNGASNTALVDSWTTKKDAKGVVTWNEDNVYIGYNEGDGRYASIYTANTIDLTNYKKLSIVVSNTGGTKDGILGVLTAPYTGVSGTTGVEKMAASVGITYNIEDKATHVLDISAVNGAHHVQVIAGIFKATIHDIYLS